MSTASATATPDVTDLESAYQLGRDHAAAALRKAKAAGISLSGPEGAFKLWDFTAASGIAPGAPEQDAYSDGWYEVAFAALS